VLKDADSTPTVAVRKNGSSTGDSVTITKRSATTGIYDCSYNPSGEVEGDEFIFEESATVTGTTTAQATYSFAWSLTVTAIERGTDSAALASGVTVSAIANNAITAASIAADAGTEIGAAVLTALGTGTWATAITDKTNNLPTDPADQSAVEAAITAAAAAIRGTDNDTLETLSDQIDGLGTGGLTTEQADTLDAIYDFTSGISGDQISVVGPVSSGGAIELILGKDYKVASESELTIAVTDTGGALHADLTSGTLAASKAFGASRENGEAVITGTVYSTTYATNVLTIKVEVDADQLPDSLPLANDWRYQIHRVTSSGDKVVVVSGQLTTSMRTV